MKIKFIKHFRCKIGDLWSKDLYLIGDIETVSKKVGDSMVEARWAVDVSPKKAPPVKAKKPSYKKKVVTDIEES